MTATTITEAKILKAASETYTGGFSVTVSGGKGVRASAALRSLVAAGLMKDCRVSSEKETHRGRITRFVTITATITNAGRSALAEE
jgi:hypothetical protein